MEILAWIFGFLHFHRRIIIGLILLGALAYWLMYGKDLVPRFQPKNNRPDVTLEDPEPTTASEEPSTESIVAPPTESADSSPAANVPDVQKLIDETIRLDASWPKANYSESFIIVSRKLKIAKQLLAMDSLTDIQRRFAENSLIESVSVMDSINVQGGLRIPNVRDLMLREVQPYLDDSNDQFRNLACLTMVCYPSYDYLVDPSAERLQLVRQRFDQYFETLRGSKLSEEKLFEIVVRLFESPEFQDQTYDYAVHALEKFKTLDSDRGKQLTQLLEQRIYFGRLNLPTLVDRMQRQIATAGEDIEALKSGLKKLPSASLEVFQIALDVVRAHIELDQRAQAIELIEFLRQQVVPRIENQEKRENVINAMDEFKPFLR